MKTIIIYASILLQCAFAQPLLPSFFPTGYYHPSADSLLWCLKSYHTDTVHTIDPSYFSPKKNVTDSVKAELLSLLRREWTENEIKNKVKDYLKKKPFKKEFEWMFWNRGIFDTIKNISIKIGGKDFDSIYHSTYNKLEIHYKQNIEEEISGLLISVPNEIVLSAGTAEIKEAILLLKKDLASTRHAYDTSAAQLALLRLGDTTYKKKYIGLHRKYVDKEQWNTEEIRQDVNAMKAIHTQKSIELLADWIDTSRSYQNAYEPTMDRSQIPFVYYSGYVVLRLLSILENKGFRAGFKKLPLKRRPFDDYSSPECMTVEQMLFTKRWMLANKGKYEFE